jgi:cytochrome P450
VIEGLIEEWAPKRSFDFEQFASYFPITVMCRMLGASPTVIPRLRSSLEALGLAFGMGRDYLPTLQASVTTLQTFVRELVADRRAGERPQPEPDLLDRLIDAQDRGGIDEEELYNLLIFLFGAGYDTSKNVLTLIMHRLLDHPADYARCGEDPAFARRLIDEALRYESPSSATRRVIESFTLRDVELPAGTLMMIPWSMLGRDPTAVADPDIFIPERPGGSTHVAFGLGPHICLGQFIARAQIEEGLHLIARRFRNPRLAGPIGWRPFPGVWGIRGLPIEFDTTATK